MDQKIPENILNKICSAFDEKNYALYLKFFSFISANDPTRYIQILEHTLKNNPTIFNSLVLQMASDCEKSVQDDSFKNIMTDLWANYLDCPNKSIKGLDAKDHINNLITMKKEAAPVVHYNILRNLSNLSPENVDMVLRFISKLHSSFGQIVENQSKVSSLIKSRAGVLIGVGLCAVYLAADILKSLYDWWNGRITGKRCAKIVLDSGLSLLGGFGGASAGTSIGAVGGPIGMMIGGVIGGIIGTQLAGTLADWLTTEFFDLPKEVALENAFAFLGLNHHASNSEINKKFRELCLRYHPDKGGNVDDFHKLQYSMAIIKASKGETH